MSEKQANPLVELGFKLFIITAVVAFLLAFVNYFTQQKIMTDENNTRTEAVKKVMPGDFEYKELDKSLYSDKVKEASFAFEASKDGVIQGYCVYVSTLGYGGPVNMMVGINVQGTVTGIEIISATETPGIGSRVLNSSYIEKYKGLSDPINFSKTGLMPVSGATISSTAVKNGVNKAFEAVNLIKERGGAK